MKLKYKAYGDILRPVIPVTLSYNRNSIEYEVLVDSGSDHCFFDAEVGEDIGVNKGNSEIKEVFGVGGKISLYYFHAVTMTISGKSFDIKAGFMPNLGGRIVSYGLVGQQGFFDKFIVKFDLLNDEIELRER